MSDRDDGQPILNIEGERVALGPLRRELVPLYQRWINDFGTVRNIGFPPRPITAEQEQDWYEKMAKDETEAMFTVYERGSLHPIGSTGLHEIDHRNRSAAFGIMIGDPEFRGKGYGTETTRLMLDYAFTALGLNNVMLTVFAFNSAGKRAYEKAGFREFGRRRQGRLMGGELHDEIHMDCLATDFESPVLGGIFTPETRNPQWSREP